MPLRIGYKASAEQFGPRDLVEYTVRAEEVGLDSVWVSDHFSPWRHTGGHAPFSFAWMAAVGERTSRVQIGTSVLTATFRYYPAVVAQAFATLACLSQLVGPLPPPVPARAARRPSTALCAHRRSVPQSQMTARPAMLGKAAASVALPVGHEPLGAAATRTITSRGCGRGPSPRDDRAWERVRR